MFDVLNITHDFCRTCQKMYHVSFLLACPVSVSVFTADFQRLRVKICVYVKSRSV